MRSKIVVTGASSDIGCEAAELLAAQGHVLVVLARDVDRVRGCLEGRVEPGCLDVIKCDLREPDSIAAATEQIRQRHTELQGIVHLAGVWHDSTGSIQGPCLEEVPREQIDSVLAVTIRAPMLLCASLGGLLKTDGTASVVCMSCGFGSASEARGWVDYYVANSAVKEFVRGYAAECRPRQIRVNAVAPWFVSSAPARKFYPEQMDTALAPADVAECIAWLVSDASQHISGQTIELRHRLDHR